MLAMLYSIAAYLGFVGSFLYAVAFIGGYGVPVTLDGAARSAPLEALLINVALLALFAVQHTVMARRGFKAWWTKIVPPAVERSTFVLAASVCLFLLCWCWQPIESSVWSVTGRAAVTAIWAVFWLGWAVLLLSTFLINHFELFGLRQTYAALAGKAIPEAKFVTPLFYRYVRHPIYVGFLMAFWAAPEMTFGHLLFSAGATGYILVGIWFEERDLVAHFGDRYRQYKASVGMLVPKLRPTSGGKAAVR